MVKVGKMKGKKHASGAKTGQAMQFNHALGQHILKNPLIVQALVDKVRFSLISYSISKIINL